MIKADDLLLGLGYKEVESPFDDWFVFFNEETGTSLTFKNDTQSMHTKNEIEFTGGLINAIYKKFEELGWFNTYDAMDMIDEMIENDICIETLTGMSWEELHGEE